MTYTRILSIALFALLSAATAKAEIVAHYTFDDSTNRYQDATGNGWDGNLGGSGTTFVTGVSGDAMKTTTGSKMNVTNGTTGQGNLPVSASEFSISFWATNGGNWDNWVAFDNDAFFIQDSGTSLSLYNPGAVTGYTGGSLQSTGVTFDNTLKHVVITGDSAAGLASLYINGLLNDTASWSVASTSDFGWFTVGGAFNTGIRNIAATIDDVQVYNHVLIPSQVTYLYGNPGQVVVPEPSSVGLMMTGLLGLALFFKRRKRDRCH